MHPGIKKLSYAKSTLQGASRQGEDLRYEIEIKPIYLVLGCAVCRSALFNVKRLSLENFHR